MAIRESHRGMIRDRAPSPASSSGHEGLTDALAFHGDEVRVDLDGLNETQG